MILKLTCLNGFTVTYKDMSSEESEKPNTYKVFGDAVVVITSDGDKCSYPLSGIIEIKESK